jgi:hypothetical protein
MGVNDDGGSQEDAIAALSDDDRAALADEGVVIEGLDDGDGQSETDGASGTDDGRGTRQAAKTGDAAAARTDDNGDDEDAAAADGEKRGNVGAALREAREELRQLKEQAGQDRQFLDALRERIAANRAAREEQQRQEQDPLAKMLEGRPDPEKDPFGALTWQNQKIAELVQFIQGRQQETQQQQAEREQREAVERQRSEAINYHVDRADRALGAAVQLAPDVADAYEFASQMVARELQKAGYSGQELQQRYQQALINYAGNAPDDPAMMREYVYRNARYWGWQPGMKADGAQAQSDAARQRDPATGQFVGQRQEAEAKVRGIKNLANAGKTLSRGGKDIGANDDPDVLLTLSGAEIEELNERDPELLERMMKQLERG